MKIQSLGNGTGRPVNPFENSCHPLALLTDEPQEAVDYVNDMIDKMDDFEKDNPALPLYLNNEPYLGSDVVDGERVCEVYVPYDDTPGWKPIHPNERLSDYSERGYDTRQIYNITPSAPDNDKKVAEAREGREFKGTPGPWKYVHQAHATKKTGIGQRYAVKADDEWIYNLALDKTEDLDVHRQTEANARLIAAAPELLDALQILLAAYQSDGTEDFYNLDPVELAKLAINKALGTI